MGRIEKAFETFDHVKLSGINSGISKLIVILEITKVKLENLHQINLVETLTSESNDGSDRQRYSTAYRAELHKAKPKSIPTGYFYQAPYSKEHIEAVKAVKVQTDNNEDRPRGEFRGRGRGMRGGRGGEGQRGEFVQRGGFGERGSRGNRGSRGRGERGRGRGGFRGNRGGDGERRGRGGFEGNRGSRGGDRGAPRGGRGGSR